MLTYLKNMENRLSEEKKEMLKKIWEPTVVATPLWCSRRDICILPDGEIRSYGTIAEDVHVGPFRANAYLSSVDGGLSWSMEIARGKMNSCTYVEKAGLYMAACDAYGNNVYDIERGLYLFRSTIGPDDPNPEVIKIADDLFHDTFNPEQSAYSDRIWITTQNGDREGEPTFFYSDDFGLTWNRRELPTPNDFQQVFPHKSLRWCKFSGSEPHAVEIGENKLMMIIRTPTDSFYTSYSYDGGDSWSEPQPSTFYGTNTTAYSLRLTDGRVLSFWNNTKPMPQPFYQTCAPVPGDLVKNGEVELAFTNRDAAHVAITEDGENFIGYREVLLNPVRNNADFRYVRTMTCGDKSVHQFQAFELPFNKVLVSVGQNAVSRRLVIFDIDWLYENKRTETFINGMGNITAHTYLKSVWGSTIFELGNGHCALNRTYAAVPLPDPEGGRGEVMSVSKRKDERLLHDTTGIGWNFPAAKQGRVSVEIKIAEKQARFILTDRWYNVCDAYVAAQSPFWFDLDVTDIGDKFVTVNLDFDTEKGETVVSVGEEFLFKVRMSNPCPTGLSYLMLQCATDGDSRGFYVRKLEKA